MSRYIVIRHRRKSYNQSQFYRVWNLSIPAEIDHLILWDYNIIFRTGIRVHGYADPSVALWTFQIDNRIEALSVSPAAPCRVIRNIQDLPDGNHRVVVTPRRPSFVLTMFEYVSFNLPFQNPVYISSVSLEIHQQSTGRGQARHKTHVHWP